VTSRRDPFGNFERMRRDVNDLFEDVFERAGLASRRPAMFRPRVDVYLCDQPPRVIVKADLAGVDVTAVNLELAGRTLVLQGERRLQEGEGRVFQQVEIEHGPFRREVELSVDVDETAASASYADGILTIELPVAEPKPRRRRVSVSRREQRSDVDRGSDT
jgi:HSP20 family protein